MSLTRNALVSMLVECGLVDADALEDPDGYDQGITHGFVNTFCDAVELACAPSETERRVNQIAYPGIDKRVASMKNDEPATMHEAQMTDCNHCWHGTGRMLMSNPPLSVDVCCECGAERGLRVRQPIEPGIHGPFAPEKRLGSNVGAALKEAKP